VTPTQDQFDRAHEWAAERYPDATNAEHETHLADALADIVELDRAADAADAGFDPAGVTFHERAADRRAGGAAAQGVREEGSEAVSAIDVLQEIEWSGEGQATKHGCPKCGAPAPRYPGGGTHVFGCKLAAALREPTEPSRELVEALFRLRVTLATREQRDAFRAVERIVHRTPERAAPVGERHG